MLEKHVRKNWAAGIKGVFFDLYGTLLVFENFDKANLEWENTFYKLTGKKHHLEFYHCQRLCRDILELTHEKDSSLGLTTYETKIKKGLENFNINLPLDELKYVASATVSSWQKEIQLADDAVNVIKKLKQNKVTGLITNFDHTPHVYKVLEETGLKELFDFVIVSDDAGIEKPSPEIFKMALEKSNLNSDEVVYIGDNLKDDICGAVSAGIKPIFISRDIKSHYNHVENQDELFPKGLLRISSLSDLTRIFE